MKSKTTGYDKTVVLAGNPNVGKSTVFNELTGLKQHTGNWTGKTVELAYGYHKNKNVMWKIVDLPGTYSLFSHSPEESVARDYILKGEADKYAVVCDASCLERNLLLVLQILEVTKDVVLVLNLWDEAEKYSVNINTDRLSALLGVPVVKASARNGKGIRELTEALEHESAKGHKIKYDSDIEYAVSLIDKPVSRFEKLKIISSDDVLSDEYIHVKEYLWGIGYYPEKCSELICGAMNREAGKIASECVSGGNERIRRNLRIDKALLGKYTAVPIMLILLCAVLFITIFGANYPSELLSSLFGYLEIKIDTFLMHIGVSDFFREMLVYGLWRVLGWVVAVMLPPMAIFFPLFTLLEDSGILPRIAFNMDRCFDCAHSCGKQSLTMCMGLGCNAVGVCGCRIIDSPRERLIAMLTNVFLPCNGRFPMILTLISVFFAVGYSGLTGSVISAFILCLVIIFGIAVTLTVSALLSKTMLRGIPSSFTLELPPYRMPKIGKVLTRSFLDRTLFVLGRSISVAAPAGIVIWLLSNINVADVSILEHVSRFLDPFAGLFGFDGVILLGFILGLPANEIVLPIIIMAYTGSGHIVECGSLSQIRSLLVANGWNAVTCISVIIFCLCHFPCSTTLLTVKKETGSMKWTLAAFGIPTFVGLSLCALINLFGLTFF